ncbi:MAG: ABC transporter permease [Thermomicrobiales bacterium]|nr:ABC transporter permease [Thermomicrobiales bacterium]
MASTESARVAAIEDIQPQLDAAALPERDWTGLGRGDTSAPGYWSRAWRRFRRNRVAVIALIITTLIIAFCLAAPLISRYVTHFTYYENHLGQALSQPGENDFILGSDGNGRDVLTRLAFGGRVSLLVAVLAAMSILIIGGSIGAVAGYFGGWIDTVLMRAADVLLSIPTLVLLILVSSFYQPSPAELAILIALVSWAGVSRLIRGEVLALKHRDFVDAARVLGASNSRIISRHLFPNIVPQTIVWASLAIPGLILTEAALSYLGLGVRAPQPSWGNMLQDAKQYVRTNWTLVFIPGLMIYITVLCINLVGSGLRDALDPRLNQ